MKRRVLRIGAIIGAATVSTLAVAPAFAAATVSHSTAQSLQISIAGNSAVSQKVSAANDGTDEQKNNADTLPKIADLLPGNTLLGPGVAPQAAVANPDGTSYACAGIAGTGSEGVVTVGNSSCNLDGEPITIDLAKLDLGTVLLTDSSVLGNLLTQLGLSDALLQAVGGVNGLVTKLSDALDDTPLGEIKIGGALSAIEASCTADPGKAEGDARLVDTSGGSEDIPISITLPNVGDVVLVNLPANPPPNTKVLTDLDVVTQALVTALTQEFNTALQGKLAGLGLGNALQSVQDQVVKTLVANLQPLLQPLEQYLLDITLNKQVVGDGGRSIDVTALDAKVLPALKQAAGASLIDGKIGEVTCGPNSRPATTPPGDTGGPGDGDLPDVPTVVDSGVAGKADHTARNVLGATGALMLLAGTAGLLGYRRMLNK